MAKITRKKLINAAKELNSKLGLDPEIDVSQKSGAIESLLKEASEYIQENDGITPKTVKVLTEIGAKLNIDTTKVVQRVKKKSSKKKSSSKSSEEKTTNESPEKVTHPLVAELKKRKKLDDLKAFARTHEDFITLQDNLENYQGLDGTKELKDDMLAILGEKPKSSKKSSKKKSSKKKFDGESSKKKSSKKKSSKKKSSKKVEPVKKEKKQTKTERALEYIKPYIESGKYTEKELMEMTDKNTEISYATAWSIISKAKNPKYCKFDREIVKDKNTGKISFGKKLSDATK